MRQFCIFMFFVCLTIPLVAQQRQTLTLSPLTTSSNNEDSPRLKQLRGIFSKEDSVDRKLDKKAMSVRWTGKIQVPATGNYVFLQVPSLYGNSKVKLWIDGQLVLDTHGKNNRNSLPDSSSNTVPLTAGKPSDFRLEFSHRNFGKRDFPTAALTWKSEVLDKQIIPPAAFVVAKNNAGLNGEYFADENFKRKAFTRIDESVEFIWDQGSVEKHFAAESRKTIKSILPQITSDSFLASLTEEELKEFTQQIAPALLSGMVISERLAFIDTISRQHRILRGLPINNLLHQLSSVGLLSGEKNTELLLAWSEENPQPRLLPGTFISGSGTFYTLNVYPYIKIGQFLLSSDLSPDNLSDSLINSIECPNGECNLTITYSLICTGKDNRLLPKIIKQIESKLADTQISGDIRVTWLFAKAYFQEIGLSQTIQPGRGIAVLKEALNVAKSSEYRFWALGELAARLITIDRTEEAQSLIADMRNQFSDQEQLVCIDEWLSQSEEIVTQYNKSKHQRQTKPNIEFSKELNRRSNLSIKIGDTQSARDFQAKAEAAKASNNWSCDSESGALVCQRIWCGSCQNRV